MTSLQTDILVVSIMFWAIVVLTLAWITNKIRELEATLKEIRNREGKQDED